MVIDAHSPVWSTAMRQACREARRWLGATSPNPPVGAAALDDEGNILALAAHRRAGEEHAEAALINLCREQNLLPRVNAIAVTLEPCNHLGKTPPCCDTLIDAGIRRVFVGLRDPNPNVKGGGCQRLRDAGVDVMEGIETEACRRLIHAFASFAQTRQSFVTVKRAFDTRGSMIPPVGQKTFTNKESLILAHRLRKKADAIVTGSGTIRADSPLFTVRYVADFEGKRRILAILDRRGRVSQDYKDCAAAHGFDVVVYQNIDSCFLDLANRNIQDVLVESGPLLSQAVLDSPYWTMRVDVHKNETEKIDVSFNKKGKVPFETEKFDIEEILPL